MPLAPIGAGADTATTTLISVTSAGTSGHDFSQHADVTPDGRFVAFASQVPDLVAGDTNKVPDVFVRDRATATTTRVSVTSTGAQGNDFSQSPSISADGRYVAFSSRASNLVAGDTNFQNDVFLHDRTTASTTRVSVTSAGGEGTSAVIRSGSFGPEISDDGRYIVFETTVGLVEDDVSGSDIYLRDRQAGTTTRLSAPTGPVSQPAPGGSRDPAMSRDGRIVAFASTVPNLVSGDTNGVSDANAGEDVFVHDRTTVTTTRVSVATGGTQSDDYSRVPAISADGRHVMFVSKATNLVNGDGNGTEDVFAHDRQTGTTTRVSVSSTGSQATDGVSSAQPPAISGDGRYVAFGSKSADLVTGDTNSSADIFVRDRQAATTTRVSLANDDSEASGGDSGGPSISDDGTVVAFESEASNLAGGDTNTIVRDVFVRDADDVVVERVKPLLSVGDVKLVEGDVGSRSAVFNVMLSKPTAAAVTADFATANGSATTANRDYTAKSGSLSFSPGATSLTVKVPVTGDGTKEASETFTLTLSNITKAIAGDVVGVGLIMEDEPAPVTGAAISANDVTVYEGDGGRTAVFTVSLSRPLTSTVTVAYATGDGLAGSPYSPAASAPDDYMPVGPGTLTFAAGTTSLTVKVPVISDNATEATETFRLILTQPTGGASLLRSVGSATVIDDD